MLIIRYKNATFKKIYNGLVRLIGWFKSYLRHGYFNTRSLCVCVLIYWAFCLDVAEDRMNGAPNENRTHSCRFASLPC